MPGGNLPFLSRLRPYVTGTVSTTRADVLNIAEMSVKQMHLQFLVTF